MMDCDRVNYLVPEDMVTRHAASTRPLVIDAILFSKI
jgi:hypothetical protein